MSSILYGIRHCDTMKKAMHWLETHRIEFEFHDYRSQGIDTGTLRHWLAQVPWEDLINRRGTTWRRLDPADRDHIDEDKAVHLMQQNPSLIRRPVLALDEWICIGFTPEGYATLFHEPLTKPCSQSHEEEKKVRL
jgi:arsenate reductase